MTQKIPHFIDGRRSNLSSTRTADVFNPSTGEVQAQVLLASAADVDTAVASAKKAQKEVRLPTRQLFILGWFDLAHLPITADSR